MNTFDMAKNMYNDFSLEEKKEYDEKAAIFEKIFQTFLESIVEESGGDAVLTIAYMTSGCSELLFRLGELPSHVSIEHQKTFAQTIEGSLTQIRDALKIATQHNNRYLF